MDQEKDRSRVFLGADILAPWPANFPKGKIITEKYRHITLAFLGDIERKELEKLLHFPKPNFRVGLVGRFTKPVFLPSKHPNVVAYEIEWIDGDSSIKQYQKELIDWLDTKQINVNKEFYSHVSISRGQFDQKEWEEDFSPLPFYVNGIHLYESLGNSEYKKLSSHSLVAPFEEIHHTADIAYLVKGESLQQLHRNAEVALSFSFPPIISFIGKKKACNSLEEIVIDLNEHVSQADISYGCSFKAVSFHGRVQQTSEGIFQWEMIIDV